MVASVDYGVHGLAFAADATSTGLLDDHQPDAPCVLASCPPDAASGGLPAPHACIVTSF